jgi:hypothetical protein
MDGFELLLGEAGHRIGRMHIAADCVVADDPIVEASLFFLDRQGTRHTGKLCFASQDHLQALAGVLRLDAAQRDAGFYGKGFGSFGNKTLSDGRGTHVASWAAAEPDSMATTRAITDAVRLIISGTSSVAAILTLALGTYTTLLSVSSALG